MDGQTPVRDIFRQKLIGTYWVFGPNWGEAKTTRLVFGATGRIENYEHPNEHSWAVNGGRLEIYDSAGALMWFGAARYVENDVFCIALKTPRDANAAFVLKEFGPRNAVAAPPPVAAAKEGALSPADFLFPKDLEVTPVKLGRVLLIGSCMTALYHQEFQRIAPATAFDYIVFNYAGVLPQPPAAVDAYDLQYVQLPLRSVLTDHVVWATRFNDDGFAEGVLNTARDVIDAMLASALAFNESHGLLTFVSNFIVPQMSVVTNLTARYSALDIAHIVRELNDYLANALLKNKNVFLADVNGIAESIGKQYVLDDMINFYAHNGAFFNEWVSYERPERIEPVPAMAEFYTSKRLEFSEAVYRQIIATYRTYRQMDQVKAVVFDLDHTLWRGQLAEHYRPGEDWPKPDGWPIGIWEAVHHLRARGILVSICSKNDEAMVRRDWDNAVQPKFISLDDFVSVKINWKTKAENILEICGELNIKPKSLVFVDDNPVERAAVQAAIPEIRVIGSNPYLTRRILLWAPETQITSLTKESAQREEMVRGQIVREAERKTLSREEFLQSLNCAVSFIAIHGNDQPEFARVVELVNKTNQFNTTGKRWTAAEIQQFCMGGDVLAFRVQDRFTDYGLVGVLFCAGGRIVQFVMSCRVLGMDVELFAVSHAATLLRAKKPGLVVADLLETADNSPCRDVFARAGFTAQDGVFVLAADAMPATPAHIRLL
jgi:FkbH-like protein